MTETPSPRQTPREEWEELAKGLARRAAEVDTVIGRLESLTESTTWRFERDWFLQFQRECAVLFRESASALSAASAAKDEEIARLSRIIEVTNGAIERRMPCPDHRDKFTPGECHVCQAEKRGADEGYQRGHKRGVHAALDAWDSWRKTLPDGAFTHPDGVRFVQAIEALSESR